jgi:type VI secretion system secreted protein VgrG
VRLDEHQCRYEVATGHGDCRGIAVGRTLRARAEHPIEAINQKYLVTSAVITAESDPYGTGRGRAGGESFSVSFTSISAEQQFRPARVTPLPFVRGPQTAIVVGPSGEEIHTDDHGRVKVMFHWDREAKARRDEFVLGPGEPGVCRQGLGQHADPPGRARGDRVLPGG